jgi:hypothetical protein
MPEDLVTILSKDEEKQKAIREKSQKDAESAKARAIGSTTNAPVAQRPPSNQQSKQVLVGKPSAQVPAKPTAQVAASSSTSSKLAAAKKNSANMLIPEIPPFRGAVAKAKTPLAPTVTVNGTPLKAIPTHAQVQAEAKAKAEAQAQAAAKLNANASSFRPTATIPKASQTTP